MTPAPLSTINDLFCRVAAAANPRAILWQDEFGHWQPISSDQIYQRVRALAEAFLSWGAKKGDRIALIAENRWEWAVTDFAILAIGAVNVPDLSHAHRRADRRAAGRCRLPHRRSSPPACNSTSSTPFARKPSSSASS